MNLVEIEKSLNASLEESNFMRHVHVVPGTCNLKIELNGDWKHCHGVVKFLVACWLYEHGIGYKYELNVSDCVDGIFEATHIWYLAPCCIFQ